MFDNLAALGYGLVTFAIIIGVGTIVLTKFGDSVATCGTDFTFNESTQTVSKRHTFDRYNCFN